MISKALVCIAALGVLALPVAAQQATSKVAYVNMREVASQAPGAKAAQAEFQEEMDGYRAELKLLQDTITTMVSNYQDQESTLSTVAKQQQQNAIQAKEQAYQQRVQDLQQEANKKQQALIKPIQDKIDTVINELRKEKGYEFIFDSSAPFMDRANRSLLAADPALDITKEVIARLATLGSSSGKSK